ncbi:MAG: hypothetical protein HZB39_17595 [Planctomycetes bacterium]|nr:hypothetical protein [Planctomycetota bacterium]
MRRCFGALAVSLAVVACGGPAVHDDWWQAAGARDDAEPLHAAAFADATRVCAGFDEPASPEVLAAKDQALFAVELREDDVTSRWLLLVEVVDPVAKVDGEPAVATGRIAVRTDSGGSRDVVVVCKVAVLKLVRMRLDGSRETGSQVLVPRLALEHGFAKACAIHVARGHGLPDASDQELDDFGRTLVSLLALLDIVQSDEQLAAILQSVARTPSLASIVGRLGVHIAVVPDFLAAHTRGVWRGSADPVWRIPLTITANDEAAVLVLADIVEPRSPHNLAAGLLRLTARRPGDARARLVMELLAARRAQVADARTP